MQFLLIAEDCLKPGDRGNQLGALLTQHVHLQRNQPPQRHLKNMAGLDLGQFELLHQRGSRNSGVLTRPDRPHNLVHRIQRDQQTVNNVLTRLGLLQTEPGPAGNNLKPVHQEHVQQIPQPKRFRLTVYQGKVRDTERRFQRRQPVQLRQQRLRIHSRLTFDHQTGTGPAIGQVLHVRDSLQTLLPDFFLHLLNDLLRTDPVRELRHHDAHPAAGPFNRDDFRASTHPDRALARLVRQTNLIQAQKHSPRRQVRSRDQRHQVIQRRARLTDQHPDRGHNFTKVMRDHVRRHADRDTGSPVDQQVRERCRKDRRFGHGPVIVRGEIYCPLIQLADQQHRGRRHPAFGVPHSRRTVTVRRTEVAMPVHQRRVQREPLRHPDQRLIDRAVTMRMVAAHDIAYDTR